MSSGYEQHATPPGLPADEAPEGGPLGPGAEQHDDEGHHHHRNVQGGAARAAVFGLSDGLVTNVSLILGVAGARPGANYVRLAGLAGLLAGAFSMAAGEFVSVSAQRELTLRELEVERRAIRHDPEEETRELAEIYRRRGLSAEAATTLAHQMMKTPEMALEAHAREEIGIDPRALVSPYPPALFSLISFALGAIVPLVPWFFISGNGAIFLSLALVAVAAVVIGIFLSRATGRSAFITSGRQLLVSMLAAGVTYLVGRLIGVNVVH